MRPVPDPLTDDVVEQILRRLPGLTIGVLGDLFLDRYLDLDAALTEPSIETGLDAYQVVRVRSSPGAAGTVINNLHALGVGTIVPISMIGADGEGYELRQALDALARRRFLGDSFRRGAADADLHQADAAPRRRGAARAEPARHQEPHAHAGEPRKSGSCKRWTTPGTNSTPGWSWIRSARWIAAWSRPECGNAWPRWARIGPAD